MKVTKTIGLADCNNFYVSCERVFNPKLSEKPVIVLSNNDSNAIARSQEAKDVGIKMGESVYKSKDLIESEGVHLFSSNYSLYADMSERVVEAIKHFAPEVEIYSIDEVFINLDHVSPENLPHFLEEMREKVRTWTGIPISIGSGPTKTLAKLANKIAKKGNGVYCIDDIQAFSGEYYPKIGLSDVWGIGERTEEKLKSVGCESIDNFVSLPGEWVRKNLTVVGLRTQSELKGVQCIPFTTTFKMRKNISTSRSFGSSTSDFLEVQKAVHLYTRKAVDKLRTEGLSAGSAVLYLANDRYKEEIFYHRSFRIPFLEKTNKMEKIWPQIQKILISAYSKEIRYRSAGIRLGDLCLPGHEQLSLFQEEITPVEVQEPEGQNWKMRRDFLSRSYTTSWEDIPVVAKALI